MTVHPNHFGRGVGGALLKHIIDYTDSQGYAALRLTQSALNIDSYSLYNRYGFVPRYAYQDMLISVPQEGLEIHAAGDERVRDATLADVPPWPPWKWKSAESLAKKISLLHRERPWLLARYGDRAVRATVLTAT